MERQGIVTQSLEEKTRVLDQEEIIPYLTRLSSSLSYLCQILGSQEEFVKNKNAASYVKIVQDTINCFKLKYQLGGEDCIDFPLAILPRESGFPSLTNFYSLLHNKENSQTTLDILPKRKEIIDMIRRSILEDLSSVNSQILLKRHNFYSRLQEADILKEFQLNEPKFCDEEKNRRKSYLIQWCGIEIGNGLPVFYEMCLEHSKGYPNLEDTFKDVLRPVINHSRFGTSDLKGFAIMADHDIPEIHPKLVLKYTIGPYYDSTTSNSDKVNDLLKLEKESFILKFGFGKVGSQGVRQYGNWLDRLRGKKTENEKFGPVISETRMIVPFRIKQELRDNNEYGKTCKVYGVTSDGGVI